MSTDLGQLLAESELRPFCPYARHSQDADAIEFYFKGVPDYSEKLTDHVTLFRSIETNEIVGCRIKNVQAILDDLPNYITVKDHDGEVELSLVLLPFRGACLDEDTRNAFNELAQEAKDKEIVLSA